MALSDSLLAAFLRWTLAYCGSLSSERLVTDWGVLFGNPSNPTHHQSNQAHVTTKSSSSSQLTGHSSPFLGSLLNRVAGYYHAYGAIPRLVIYAPLDPDERVFKAAVEGGFSQYVREDLAILQRVPSPTENPPYIAPASEVSIATAKLDDMSSCADAFAQAFGYGRMGDTTWIQPKLTA
ncbi:hypothetical protein H4R33_005712 [Dimargaris cristalligena]|nr:hypothetical protein H4R33_005712 [Dimargaris cristalligena]